MLQVAQRLSFFVFKKRSEEIDLKYYMAIMADAVIYLVFFLYTCIDCGVCFERLFEFRSISGDKLHRLRD